MFDNILGHKKQLSILEKSISNDSISHSYLFFGISGIGKLKTAKAFARLILKTDNLESNPDYVYINKKEDKKNILVDQIREKIIDNMYISPATGEKKVYIIDDAEHLNEASQNALLKTLEEPPKHSVIILIASSKTNILPTVISRLYKIEFNKLECNIVDKYINNKYNINLSCNLLKYVDGSIGLAVEIIENNIIEELNKVDKFYECISSKDIVKCFKQSEDIDFINKHILDYFEYLLFSNGKYICAEVIEKVKIRLKYNGNYDIVIDNMILKCIENI